MRGHVCIVVCGWVGGCVYRYGCVCVCVAVRGGFGVHRTELPSILSAIELHMEMG